MALSVTWSLVIVLSIHSIDVVHGSPVTISTQLGEITGISMDAFSRTVYNFNGIGYSTPPIGDLRFRQARLNTSGWSGVYDATQAGPTCIQPGDGRMDEDCLYLNIFTTKSNVDNAKSQLVPVMV